VVSTSQVAQRPPGLDAAHAAAIPVNGLTAWMLLEEFGRVRAGDRVLVHSAAGGVGLTALDLLRRRGAWAAGMASPAKHDFLRERGYSLLLDSRDPEALAELHATGQRFDLILDPVGGRSWRLGLRLLRPGGRLLCYGFSAGVAGPRRSRLRALRTLARIPWLLCNPIWLMNHNRGLCGVNLGHLWGEGERLRSWLQELLRLWERGELHPHVHAQIPFSEAADAHRLLHERGNLGKVLLTP